MLARLGAFLLVILALSGPALGADWGGIQPGVTTQEQVRERYGPATRTTSKKLEGYDTTESIYEGGQAPTGMVRMVVEYGMLTPQGYRPALVRVFRLDPKPFIYGKNTVVDGWGIPDRAATEQGRDYFFYESGLLVTFDKDGVSASSMYFTVPQTRPAAPAGGGPATPPAPSRQ
jgi:hypothetical protein